MLLASHTYSDTTGDILDPSTISGSYEPCSGSDCWGGYSGGSNPSWNGGTARWGYGAGILAWNYALEQALANVGINIDGYNYSWFVKNGDAGAGQNDGNDYMRISVRFYDANNDELWGKQYNLDGTYNWTTFSGQELFTSPLSGGDVSTIVIRAEGNDPGFWAGHYGPEFDTSASSVTLIYSNNPCYPDPLVDSTCPGYAEAYANKLLEEQLAAQQEAAIVIEEQPVETVTINPTETILNSPSMDMGTTQNNGASGSNPESVTIQETTDREDDKKQKLDLARSLDPANNMSLINSITAGPSQTEEIPGMEQLQAAEQQVIGGIEGGFGSTEDAAQTGMVFSQSQSQNNVGSNQSNTESRQERRERLKEITENRANEISEQNAEADSMDEQSQQQLEQLALMNYVPGFDTYSIALDGGLYPDAEFYKPTTVPESKRGLRNGLAQQLLHEQMIEMQYRREQ